MSSSSVNGALFASFLLAFSPSLLAQDPPAELTLDGALAHAEVNAPAIKVALARATRAEAFRAHAAPLFPGNPEVSATGGPRIRNSPGVDAELAVSQRFEIAGEPSLRREVAERRAAVLEAELAAVRWEVHGDVHAAFHVALVARARREALLEAEAFAREVLEIAAARAKAGDISPLQETQARIELARAGQDLRAADQQYFSSRITLAELAGWLDPSPPEPRGSLGESLPARDLRHLVELAGARQPRLLALARDVDAARSSVALEEREAWPEPALGASYGIENGGLAPLGAEHLVLATVAIPIPLWQRNQGGRAGARSDLALAEAERDTWRSRLPARIARAKERVDVAAKRIAAYESEILPSVRETLGLLRKAFELGEADITTVMVGRERFLAARREALDAYDDYYAALSELEAEIGADADEALVTSEGGAP